MVEERVPTGVERVVKVLLHAEAQVVELAHQGEDLTGHRRSGDIVRVHPVLAGYLASEGPCDRPVPGALRLADLRTLGPDLTEVDFRVADWGIALLARNHAGDGLTHDLLQHRPDTVCTHRGIVKFCRHVSLSCFHGGQQVGRPLYRFGENLVAERNRQKFRGPKVPDFFGPTASKMEDTVSANQVQTPFSACDTRPAPRPM
jgi:hypothetical protein